MTRRQLHLFEDPPDYPSSQYPDDSDREDLSEVTITGVLPCHNEEGVAAQVGATVQLLNGMDQLHPEVLLQHGIQPADYHPGLVFRSAVESIHFGALDYARDNRLRLWFLGCREWKELDRSLTANNKVYIPQMTLCLKEMNRVLKNSGYCVLVLGDVERDGKTHRTAEILSELAATVTGGGLQTELICDDTIPDERRTRRRTATTKFERILVMRKKQ